MKKFLSFAIMAFIWLAGSPLMVAAGATGQEGAEIFVPRNPDDPIRRREGGLVTDLDEAIGSISRGVGRGAARGVGRGAARGADRGVGRGAARGADRGVGRGAARGAAEVTAIDETADPLPPDILAPLAPKQTGLTADPKPRLLWYLSDAWAGPVHFTINRPKARAPDLEITLDPPADAGVFQRGIHGIDLRDYGITLEEGVDYEWFVFIILDPVERSADLMASATIRYVPSRKSFTDYREYGKAGYWYDSISDLTNRIGKAPEARELWAQRAAMIDQVGMPLVAQFDRESD